MRIIFLRYFLLNTDIFLEVREAFYIPQQTANFLQAGSKFSSSLDHQQTVQHLECNRHPINVPEFNEMIEDYLETIRKAEFDETGFLHMLLLYPTSLT